MEAKGRMLREIGELSLDEIGEHYGRYRLPSAESEKAMVSSLARYGQISCVIVCRREQRLELVDGFKRLAAARSLVTIETLRAREIAVDERTAKAAMCALNRVASRMRELEEAWIVHALVREDGLSQSEVAELLGRHKSFVCRRLALIERLVPEVKEDLRLGLVTPSQARELLRLPAGNQRDWLEATRRESLSRDELRGALDLWLVAAPEGKDFVLQSPRDALARDRDAGKPGRDPRLSILGNRVSKQIGLLLEAMPRLENQLRCRVRTGLTPSDEKLLAGVLARLSREARSLAEAADDFGFEPQRRWTSAPATSS